MSWRRKVGLVIRYSMEFGGLKDFCVCISIDGWVFSALIESQFHGSIYLHTLQPILMTRRNDIKRKLFVMYSFTSMDKILNRIQDRHVNRGSSELA